MNPQLLENRKKTAERLGVPEEKIPHHVAIIMDGNGRWAEQRGEPRFVGHREGGKRVEPIVLGAIDLGIEAISLYSFSLQNWKRPAMEVDFLMQLFTRYLVNIRDMLMGNNVRLQHLGRREGLSDTLLEALDTTVELTKNNTGLILGLALNYGSREEIVDATKSIATKVKNGEIAVEDIDEELFNNSLTTVGMPEPDLVVRTSKELRLSNYLLWQISYAEFYVTEKLWPDFEVSDLEEAILTFSGRSRRLGDITAEQ